MTTVWALLAIVAGVFLRTCAASASNEQERAANSTFHNPIFPGFHPDPSCVFVPKWDDTTFCATSSFNSFPGLPIHATKDLQNWRVISHALNREEQLPRLAETNRSTSGIWAPTLRYHDGTFWLVTTLVDDDRAQEDASRWDNIILKTEDPYDASSWSIATHFEFEGYDPSPFWHEDGRVFITAAHAWRVSPGISQAEVDLDTGHVGEWKTVWNGTGGLAPEGPHVYQKDGYYYLLVAEGGTGAEHMITIARSKDIDGPYESNPSNPILTNTNTTNHFQGVGHGDLFQDKAGNWWAVSLSTRGGPEYLYFPMGRETVMSPASWEEGGWPVVNPIRGKMEGWPMPSVNRDIPGDGPWIGDAAQVSFQDGSELPPHFIHWRYPVKDHFKVSPKDHPNTLRIKPSNLNLTALNGNYAGPSGLAFVGERQRDTLFTFSVHVDFSPSKLEEEAGISAFLTQNHHFDMGVVMLPAESKTASFPGITEDEDDSKEKSKLRPHFRFRGISYVDVPEPVIVPVPEPWVGQALRLEISAKNRTHYSFSAGPATERSKMQTIIDVSNEPLSWGFTGVILGAYATSNGGEGKTPVYISDWNYESQGQFRD